MGAGCDQAYFLPGCLHNVKYCMIWLDARTASILDLADCFMRYLIHDI